jgi:hypothetical protein
MSSQLNVVIFSKAAGNQQYGLGQDAKLVELVLREMNATGKTKIQLNHRDPYTYVGQGSIPTLADIHIYLEVPCRGAFPWAKINVIIPNQEWWYTNEWNWAINDPSSIFLYRTQYAEKKFSALRGSYISWRCPVTLGDTIPLKQKKHQALYIVGGSINKRVAAENLVKFWKPNYPPLIIAISQELSKDLVTADNITYKVGYMTELEKTELQKISLYHVTASIAEGFGYTMAEALNFGAIPIWTDIPAYKEFWGELLGEIGKISTFQNLAHNMNLEMLDTPCEFTEEALDVCMKGLQNLNFDNLEINFMKKIQNSVNLQTKKFRNEFQNSWKIIERAVSKAPSPVVPPKMIKPSDIPVVGIVTLIYNRPEWFSHAVRNIQTCDYPRDKMIWVIVDDSDGMNRVDINVEKIKKTMPDLKIRYVSSGKRLTIGEKRNRGCQAVIDTDPLTSVFAFMDDDDHYPKASLIMRILWLINSKKSCVYCSTLPMYHIQKYISAINVPPLNLSPCKRVSEASMCFKRTFWEERKFPSDISIAEGELFLQNRENDTMEIPPEGIIVSFLHGKNTTSRRVPEEKEANGCHYGFSDEYFTMISRIAPPL